MKLYTGIGSRETPGDVLELMQRLAQDLRRNDYRLRSGHAPGADQAFEAGAGATAEVYLPWAKFEAGVPVIAEQLLKRPALGAFDIASRYHPGWRYLRHGARALHARNVHQILGEWLDRPTDFVVCWTPDGSRDGSSPKSGGTGQALRIAAGYGIPVYNLWWGDDREAVEELARSR